MWFDGACGHMFDVVISPPGSWHLMCMSNVHVVYMGSMWSYISQTVKYAILVAADSSTVPL